MPGAVIFSGHMVDRADRPEPRFPSFLIRAARAAIAAGIEDLTDSDWKGVSGAACGGDLLFCDAWLAMGRSLEVHLPQPVEPFLDESVRFAGFEWVELFHRILAHPTTAASIPGAPLAADMHTANNLAMLASAVSSGSDLAGVFLWNGLGGDGPGGTAHMAASISDRDGRVKVIDPPDLVQGWLAAEPVPGTEDLRTAHRLLANAGRAAEAEDLADRFGLRPD
jgi:hypothetical protein